jgi:CHAT domain-containing protein
MLYKCLGRLDDLEESISNPQKSICLTEDGHPNKSMRLSNLALGYLARFERFNQQSDIEDCISNLQAAVHITDDNHLHKAMYLSNLGTGQLARFTFLGQMSDLVNSIANMEKSVQMTDDGNPNKALSLANLGTSQNIRFDHNSGAEITDIEHSISNLRHAIWLTADGNPNKAKYIHDLGVSQRFRFHYSGEMADIEDSILHLQSAVDLTGDGHLNKPAFLYHLSRSQRDRFRHLDQLDDIQDAIQHSQTAVQVTADGHSKKPTYISQLSITLADRFRRLGDLSDLESAILNAERAVQLSVNRRADSDAELLSNLGTIQKIRFHRLGELTDIVNSISNLQTAADFTEDGHPHHHRYIYALGVSQRSRFERLGELLDIENSCSNLQTAVQLIQVGHPDRAQYLTSFGNSQLVRFESFGELQDIIDSIENLQKAVDSTSGGRVGKAEFLSNLGLAQCFRFKRLGHVHDIEQSISNLHRATQVVDDVHPVRTIFLCNLGISQMMRYQLLGQQTDIDNSVANLQESAQFIGDEHPDKSLRLTNLGHSQLLRFQYLGNLTDLGDSISNFRKANQLLDDGHAMKAKCLSGLSNGQYERFCRLGERTDIENCISSSQKVVQLTDAGHPARAMRLSNLLLSHMPLSHPTEVDRIILDLREAIQFIDNGDPRKAMYLSNLGDCQRSRFKRNDNLAVINDSILNLQEAVQLAKDEDISKPTYLINLGLAQQARYLKSFELLDLELSASNLKQACEKISCSRRSRVMALSALGMTLYMRFKIQGDPADRVASLEAFKAVTQSKAAFPYDVLEAAQTWADMSHRAYLSSHLDVDLSSAIDAYRIALETLPKVAWLGLSAKSLQEWLWQVTPETLSCNSATCAIQQGRYAEAVELLDLGRSVFWQQASPLRADLEELRAVNPQLADQLGRVGRRIDVGTFSGSLEPISEYKVAGGGATVASEERLYLVNEWESLLARVRKLPQFKHFLRPLPFRHLCQTATTRRIIIINVSKFGADALILNSAHRIDYVPLPNVDLETLHTLGCDVALQQPKNASAAQRRSYTTRYLKPALRMVWNDIINPIFNAIQLDSSDNSGLPRDRIWWYVTGPLTFIPIHAAGPRSGDIDVSKLVVSSYITTLGSIVQAQKKLAQHAIGELKFLAVSQPDTPGQESLPSSVDEVDKVIRVIISADWPTKDIVHLTGSDATIDRVLGALDSGSWFHIACHGMQHPVFGMQSAFALYDGELQLSHIASKRLTNAGLAFLSACHTAASPEGLKGEALHLAGSLEFAGFLSVIATMWVINDKDAPVIARYTYEYLFQNGLQNCDPSKAAAALNYAVQRLREDPTVTMDRWAPFIHFGI